MTDYSAQIASVIRVAPSDLVSYYEQQEFPVYPGSRIRCLAFGDAKDYSRRMQAIPVASRLGLWVLDDASDSNPYAYISSGACAGMIIHFSHDPEPVIAFSSLFNFLSVMRDVGTRGLDIDDAQRENISAPLESVIRELAEEGESTDRTFLLAIYLPLCAELKSDIKSLLASDADFFVREALAAYVTQRPRVEDLELVQSLSRDDHPQVAKQARAAVAVIRQGLDTAR